MLRERERDHSLHKSFLYFVEIAIMLREREIIAYINRSFLHSRLQAINTNCHHVEREREREIIAYINRSFLHSRLQAINTNQIVIMLRERKIIHISFLYFVHFYTAAYRL